MHVGTSGTQYFIEFCRSNKAAATEFNSPCRSCDLISVVTFCFFSFSCPMVVWADDSIGSIRFLSIYAMIRSCFAAFIKV